MVDGAIEFRATDFLANNVSDAVEGLDLPIVLPYSALYSALLSAEQACDSLARPSLTIDPHTDDVVLEESPVFTSPEELASSDERIWRAQYTRTEETIEEQDRDYVDG